MSQRFIEVLKSLSAPPRADFMYAAVASGRFDLHELVEMFGEDVVDATLKLALEYIDAGSILVLPSKREPYLKLMEKLAAARARSVTQVELTGKHG